MERRIDRQEPAISRRSCDAKRFRDLVELHRRDMAEVGIRIRRSKDFCLTAIDEARGALKIGEFDRERLIKYGKDRAKGGAGPVTVSMDFGYIHATGMGRNRLTRPFFRRRSVRRNIAARALERTE
ncbi:hypothetical protein [Ancylobacter amanitiformis]|uniref:Uncharacterized protein n=1 Tax=Ancylobacter amanitiformis TaxID=217069 RepID=A0ABU0LMJ9_9HYPH|nr:hypothetical protein [Ancylobacter amanitiformis]MDQ0509932.1 hypothetical protein [Ancylobacter amanitiformis]